MGRAGWEVWLAYDLPGSYEEAPPTLLDELKRDRRWCQGNLQHLRLLLGDRSAPAIGRSSPWASWLRFGVVWLSFLVLATVEFAVQSLIPPAYFSEQRIFSHLAAVASRMAIASHYHGAAFVLPKF